MADTKRGWWPEKECGDCHKKGVIFSNWGPLTGGNPGDFCGACWTERNEDYEKGLPPRPIGQRSPEKDEIPGGTFRVITAVDKGDPKFERTFEFSPLGGERHSIKLINGKPLDYQEVSIRRLAVGRLMFLDVNFEEGEYAIGGRVKEIKLVA